MVKYADIIAAVITVSTRRLSRHGRCSSMAAVSIRVIGHTKAINDIIVMANIVGAGWLVTERYRPLLWRQHVDIIDI